MSGCPTRAEAWRRGSPPLGGPTPTNPGHFVPHFGDLGQACRPTQANPGQPKPAPNRVSARVSTAGAKPDPGPNQ
jgi:hypothetical protein